MAVECYRRISRGRLEIARLIEHIVSRQQTLRARGHHLAAMQKRDRIGRRTPRLIGIQTHVPHHQRRVANVRREFR